MLHVFKMAAGAHPSWVVLRLINVAGRRAVNPFPASEVRRHALNKSALGL
jgi:hypothetical protein